MRGDYLKMKREQNEELRFNKMFHKALPVVFTIFFVVIVVVGGVSFLVHFIAERMPEDVVETPGHMVSREKFVYGYGLRFEFQIVIDGVKEKSSSFHISRVIQPHDPLFNPFYDELIFVHSEADAVGFADNVIAAWPRGDGFTEGLIDGFHWILGYEEHESRSGSTFRREELTLEQFGLTYPLTVADLVDNREKINELWMELGSSGRSVIETFGRIAGSAPTN